MSTRNSLVIAVLLLAGCQKAPVETPTGAGPITAPSDTAVKSPDAGLRFIDVAGEAGCQFSYQNGMVAGCYSILESLGGGAGFVDLDGDCRLDVIVPGGGRFDDKGNPTGVSNYCGRSGPGGETLQLTDCSIVSGLSSSEIYTHGITASDVDNDGFVDLLLTGYGGLQFFHNHGDGTFSLQSSEIGLTDSLWSSSAAWGDYNGDGAVDLYVVHYVDWSPENNPPCLSPDGKQKDVCSPRRFNGLPDSLYFSNADGKFSDVEGTAGTVCAGKGLGVVSVDIDGDSDVDVYVTNDTEKNALLINEGGKFVDMAEATGTAYGDAGQEEGSMGVDAADYNNDGRCDLLVANYENESFAVYRNFNESVFQHVSRSTGVAAACRLTVGWGTVASDLDSDGDVDIFVANGHVIRHPQNTGVEQHPLVLLNESGQRFRDVAASAGPYTQERHKARGAASGDIDQDGDVDLLISHVNEPVSILQNENSPQGNWVNVRLCGRRSSREPIGARVALDLDSSSTLHLYQKGGTSYSSESSPDLLFGCGESKPQKLTIFWPSGIVQTIDAPPIRSTIAVVEPLTEEEPGRWVIVPDR